MLLICFALSNTNRFLRVTPHPLVTVMPLPVPTAVRDSAISLIVLKAIPPAQFPDPPPVNWIISCVVSVVSRVVPLNIPSPTKLTALTVTVRGRVLTAYVLAANLTVPPAVNELIAAWIQAESFATPFPTHPNCSGVTTVGKDPPIGAHPVALPF